MRRILTALALAVCLTAPAAAASKEDKNTIAGALAIAAALNSCPAGTVPESLAALALFNYADLLGLDMDVAARRLDFMAGVLALRLKEEGKHDEMCRNAKAAAAKLGSF